MIQQLLPIRHNPEHEVSSNSKSCRQLSPTIIFDDYWKFAALRQQIFFARHNNQPRPWTTDPILSTYKFTNTYRASDRVSQYLIRNVIYAGDQSPNEVFFRTILFKIFNKIETWELLKKNLGLITYQGFRPEQYAKILSQALERKKSIYSAAYIMPSGGKNSSFINKHHMHLALIQKMMQDNLPNKICDALSLEAVFRLFLSYPSIGPFLAYQYAIDINYSQLINFGESDFVVPGPGAINGIKKCFSNLENTKLPDIIKIVHDAQDVEFDRLGINFQSLWGRKLQLIDCQNLFCEIDKYSRVNRPEFSKKNGRTRIKQKFTPSPLLPAQWYPPKWKLNELITCRGSNDHFN